MVAVEVGEGLGVVGDHPVEVEGLGVDEGGVGDGDGDGGPVGAEPAPEAVRVVACAEVVVARFRIAFFFNSGFASANPETRPSNL